MALELREVRKTFPGFELGPLSLRLEPGLVYGLLGPNGAGKTTLLNVIAQQMRLAGGSITHDARQIEWGDHAWKARLAYIRETPALYDELTVAGTLALTGRLCAVWDPALATRLCERFGVDAEKQVGTLSKGTKVKLALALGLARRASVVMLDEPTAGLDPSARAEFHAIIRDLGQDDPRLCLVLSSHIFEDIDAVADEIVILRQGRISFQQARDDLANTQLFRIPSASMTEQAPDARLTWTQDDAARVLVRRGSDLSAQLAASPGVVEEPNPNPLATAYHATAHIGRPVPQKA